MAELEYQSDKARYKTTGERPLMFHKYNQIIMCPFQSKLPIVNKLTGQMQLEATPCNELCPHFAIVETLNDSETGEEMYIDISITCSGTPVNTRLVVEQDKAKEFASLMQS
jgi:hypothetical protein